MEKKQRGLRLLMGCSMVWLLAQAALTFSRGGVWTGLGAIAAASFFLIRNRRTRNVFVLIVAIVFVVSYFYIFPILDKSTEDHLSQRFGDFEPTGEVDS
jgi:hypothetical protein